MTKTLSFNHPLQKDSKTTLYFKGSFYTLQIKTNKQKPTTQKQKKKKKQKKNLCSCEAVLYELVSYVESVELSQLLYYPESLKWKSS